jgi:hypothetical protein
VSFREVDAEYGWRRLDTANTGAYHAVTGLDGVKGSQLLVERDRAVGNCHRTGFPTTMPSSSEAVNDSSWRSTGRSRLLASACSARLRLELARPWLYAGCSERLAVARRTGRFPQLAHPPGGMTARSTHNLTPFRTGRFAGNHFGATGHGNRPARYTARG